MKKAILIDVEKQEVIEILVGNGLDPIYNAIGNNCDTFCCPVSFANDDTLYSDDEILLRIDDIKGGFALPNFRIPLLNNAIILGTNEEGGSIDHSTSIEEIKESIVFFGEEFCKEYANDVMGT